MKKRSLSPLLVLWLLLGFSETHAWEEAWEIHQKMGRESPFKNLKWRPVGPKFQGGRIETVHGVPGKKACFFAGAGSGSLWKTENNGLFWRPVFRNESTFSMGDVAVSSSHPEIVWLGTGENLRGRGYAFAGTGVFKSVDQGETWCNMGLRDTHHIGRVVIDPTNPDRVFVAALGHFFSENEERGLFRTEDGGKTWTRSLFISSKVGVADVVMDPKDPRILYAATWEIISGEGSGIYKSVDGGEQWERLSGGLPLGKDTGRIGLACASENLYALIDNRAHKGPDKNTNAEVYRSTDGGETWKKTHQEPLHIYPGFGWAFGDIRISPDHGEEIYILGVRLLHSTDGGRTFQSVGNRVLHLHPNRAMTLHLDQHDLWIDPEDPDRLILGNDGGVYLSADRGDTWLHLNEIPIAEFYHISVDNAEPYNIYGGNQDNSCLFGPGDRRLLPGIHDGWRYVWLDPWSGGDGFVTLADPLDQDWIYFETQNGHLNRKNVKTRENRFIKPRVKKGELDLKTNWYTPYILSHHNPMILYYGGNRLFKSLDQGAHWRPVSPDLTAVADKKRKSNALSSISESKIEPGLIYVGTEKGIVQVTRNDGVQWTDVSEGLPYKHVKRATASQHDKNLVYVALTGIDEDDFTAYLFKSVDGGKKWTSMAQGLPAECSNVIAEDPENEKILYLGTDKGVYVSLDQGGSWVSLCGDLPTASVQDMAIHLEEKELVIGTHGESAFVLDLAPIREYAASKDRFKDGHLFQIKPARAPKSRDTHQDLDPNTLKEARITYWIEKPQEILISIKDQDEKLLKTIKGTGEAGINQVVWDLGLKPREEKGAYYIPGVHYAKPGTFKVEVKGATVSLQGNMLVK